MGKSIARFAEMMNSYRSSRFQLLAHILLTPPINLLSNPSTPDDSLSNDILKVSRSKFIISSNFNRSFQDAYKTVLQWMFLSVTLLWQIGDILSRPSWTSTSFRFQDLIHMFERHEQKVRKRESDICSSKKSNRKLSNGRREKSI